MKRITKKFVKEWVTAFLPKVVSRDLGDGVIALSHPDYPNHTAKYTPGEYRLFTAPARPCESLDRAKVLLAGDCLGHEQFWEFWEHGTPDDFAHSVKVRSAAGV